MKLGLVGYLAIGLGVATLWSGFATYRWSTASVRCDARMAEAKAAGQAEAREFFDRQIKVAAGLAESERAMTAGALAVAAGNTGARQIAFVQVPTTGACIMPRGVPSLAPAVQEARDAAHD